MPINQMGMCLEVKLAIFSFRPRPWSIIFSVGDGIEADLIPITATVGVDSLNDRLLN